MKPNFVSSLIKSLVKAIEDGNQMEVLELLTKADQAISPAFGPPYKVLCERLAKRVESLSKANQELLKGKR
jgi:hypothetical protein